MAIHTIDDLQGRLDSSLTWRRIELSALRHEISRSQRVSPDSPACHALTRGAVALLYAHWEGFFHDACSAYAEMLRRRRPRLLDLNDALLLSTLRGLLTGAVAGDSDAQRDVIALVRGAGPSRKTLPRGLVSTRSNLRFEVACGILHALGLDAGIFATKKRLIDTSLCDVRNNVAHGRYEFPSAEDYESTMPEVVAMMETLRDHLIGSMRVEGFLTSSARATANRDRRLTNPS